MLGYVAALLSRGWCVGRPSCGVAGVGVTRDRQVASRRHPGPGSGGRPGPDHGHGHGHGHGVRPGVAAIPVGDHRDPGRGRPGCARIRAFGVYQVGVSVGARAGLAIDGLVAEHSFLALCAADAATSLCLAIVAWRPAGYPYAAASVPPQHSAPRAR